MPFLRRRTVMVWGCLLVSMTVLSGLLLILEPGSVTASGPMGAMALQAEPQRIEAVFDAPTAMQSDRWNAIFVHDSGQETGNADRVGQLHRAMGYEGLGFHFVIGNGQGAGDGELQVGYRWLKQTDGIFLNGAVSICLVGDGDRTSPTPAQMRQLVELVRVLQQRLGIPPRRVRLYGNVAAAASPGRLFPSARFRDQLLQVDDR